MHRGLATAAVGACLLGVLAPAASASQLIDRNAVGATLRVSTDGRALVTYRVGVRVRHVLVWGAVNADPPSTSRPQVAFKLDYSGGRGAWKTFKNACRPVRNVVKYEVAVCIASDGSYWALQSWQRALPNYGVVPTAAQSAYELRLSHWTDGQAELVVNTGWAYRQYDQLFGQLVYAGQPVFGFRSTPAGVPLDTYGRNLYLDTYNSAYGGGWLRENSFLAHNPSGTFCYGFYPHGTRPPGTGQRYRLSVIGPGVTPDVVWEGAAPGAYEPTRAESQVSLQRSLMGVDPACRPHP
jgi:hypothetical protein